MNLLIAYDGSDSAEVAIQDLGRAGLPAVGEAVILHVAEMWMSSLAWACAASGEAMILPEWEAGRQIMDWAWQIARRGAIRVREQLPGWGVRPDVVSGSRAATIVDVAAKWPADLIVLGRRDESGLARLFHGSVTHGVLGQAPCSVRIARAPEIRGDKTTAGGTRILIGFDASPRCESAVRAACSRNWPPGSEAKLVAAIDSQVCRGRLCGDGAKSVRGMMEGAAATLRMAGLSVSTRVEPAVADRLLIDEARRWKADVIFVGSRGLGPVARVLLGGVSLAVAEHAPCTVEVIRPREIMPLAHAQQGAGAGAPGTASLEN
jgi:nucleotide-binding universal stress UspA family protein